MKSPVGCELRERLVSLCESALKRDYVCSTELQKLQLCAKASYLVNSFNYLFNLLVFCLRDDEIVRPFMKSHCKYSSVRSEEQKDKVLQGDPAGPGSDLVSVNIPPQGTFHPVLRAHVMCTLKRLLCSAVLKHL